MWKSAAIAAVALALHGDCALAVTQLTIQTCSGAQPGQQWSLLPTSLIQSDDDTSQCICGPSGSYLQLCGCDATSPSQLWVFHSDDGTVRSPDNATCWNVPGQSILPGTGILAYPCGTPINGNVQFAYTGPQIYANQSGLCITGVIAPPTLPSLLNVTQPPCNVDNSGNTDVTAALQSCIELAYSTNPPVGLYFPVGTYLVSNTLQVVQTNPGGDDGINVVPARFLSHVLIGSTTALPQRPVIRLAPSSTGFGNPAQPKPVVNIYNSGGEGVDMNNLFRGIDVDISAPGNAGAMGVSHPGAQGATVADVTVTGGGAFACFAGVNGAGGLHGNVRCDGAQYGLYVDNSQPVGVAVGMTLVNQSVSAVYHFGQEVLSIIGAMIIQSPAASGPAIASQSQAFSIVDTQITCTTAQASASVAVSTTESLYLQDVYVYGCATAAQQTVQSLPGPGAAAGVWQHVATYARGKNVSEYFITDVVYMGGVRMPNTSVVVTSLLPAGSPPPVDLQQRHLWNESTFIALESAADARRDCGAKGDNATDDTAALQACINAHKDVFLPAGRYRISATLQLQPGSRILGVSNTLSLIMAATTGLPGASPASPMPLIRTSDADAADGDETVLAFLGLVTWQHLDGVFTLDWRSRNPASMWRTLFEHRPCECLFVSAWQHLSPTDIPCQLPVNITFPKTQFRGLGRVYSFVNDDTGGIISTSAAYRHVLIADTTAFAGPTARTRFYSMNLEHAQSEANAELSNASFVDIYSIKSEGNLPILWIRNGAHDVRMLGFGGGVCPFAFNYTYPPDFAPYTPSMFRIDADVTNVTFAAVFDHGYGAVPPYWPPNGGGCAWEHGYPYPGAAVPEYPFWTFPNVTMWNCWFGERVATAYWYTLLDLSRGSQQFSQPMDKPVYYVT